MIEHETIVERNRELKTYAITCTCGWTSALPVKQKAEERAARHMSGLMIGERKAYAEEAIKRREMVETWMEKVGPQKQGACAKCGNELRGHWHETSYPVRSICCSCLPEGRHCANPVRQEVMAALNTPAGREALAGGLDPEDLK